MTIEARITALGHRHKNLEERIEEERQRPFGDELHLHDLKRRKLAIKDEIFALENQRLSA